MMSMRTKATELTSFRSAAKDDGGDELEVRPGGMLVQKRHPGDALNSIPPRTIKVRVKYESIYHEMIINSTATFGELKRMLSGPTGLHHEDQKIIYKDKERASKTFLDVVGVKDRSKMVLLDDPVSRERRYVEARRNAKVAKAARAISDIGLEVDRLGGQVLVLESVMSKGGKVADEMMSNLIDLLMNLLLRLDEIKVDGDVNQQKRFQVEKVQKLVETLDVFRIKNSVGNKGNNNEEHAHGVTAAPYHRHQPGQSVRKFAPVSAASQQQEVTSRGVVVTTQWETFDSLPTIIPSTSITGETIQHNFNWDSLLK